MAKLEEIGRLAIQRLAELCNGPQAGVVADTGCHGFNRGARERRPLRKHFVGYALVVVAAVAFHCLPQSDSDDYVETLY